MKHIAKYTCLLALLAVGVKAQAQMDVTMYHMKDLPINNQLNPAFQPKNGSLYLNFLAVPFVLTPTSIGASINGKNITPGNMLSGNLDLGSIATAVKGDFSSGQIGFGWSPLGFGFMVKDMYFSLDVQAKVHAEGRVPNDMLKLAWYGNGADETLGEKLRMEGLGAVLSAYGEMAVGFSKQLKIDEHNFILGGKVKYLQGLAYGEVGMGAGSFIHTDRDSYHITVGIDPELYIAGLPATIAEGDIRLDSATDAISFDLGKYKFGGGSRGFAFDIGGTWDLPWVEGLNVSASLLDVGFINWKGVSVTNTATDKTLVFDGFDMSGGDFMNGLLDSVQQRINMTAKNGSFRKWLAPTMYVGANYELNKYFNAGALLGFKFNTYETSPFFALSANTQNFMVNSSVSYSYYNSNHNIGLGFLFGRKGIQYHIITDNILALNYKSMQSVNLRMGLNFLLGRSQEKRRERIEAKRNGGADAYVPDNETVNYTPAPAPQVEEIVAEPQANAGTTNMSNEELLKRALAEEEEEKNAAAAKQQTATSSRNNVSSEELLKRALAEEEEEGSAVKKTN